MKYIPLHDHLSHIDNQLIREYLYLLFAGN